MAREIYTKPIDVWPHARMVEAEIHQLREAAHAAGELELAQAAKAAERAFMDPAYEIARAEATDTEPAKSLERLRGELEDELGGVRAKLQRLRDQNEAEHAEKAKLQEKVEKLEVELQEAENRGLGLFKRHTKEDS